MTHSLIIVENDLHIRYLLKRYAEKYGFEVYCSDNGEEILTFIRNRMPQVIFIDADMPGNQFQICIDALKTEDVFAKTSVVTCSYDDKTVHSRRSEGFAASVSKSLLYEDFVNLMKELDADM